MPHAKPGPGKSADAALAKSLAGLWPHREHESNSVKALLCRCGAHRWRRLGSEELLPGRTVRFCFWCSCVMVDGIIYND